jgi:hypothetical protein
MSAIDAVPVSSLASFPAFCRVALDRTCDLERTEVGWIGKDNPPPRRPIELGGAKVDKIHPIYEKQLVMPVTRTPVPAASSAGANSETLARGPV